MSRIALARCDLHPEREAAVRCPSCGRDFCRECVVEHDGRLLCRRCLSRSIERSGTRRRRRPLAAIGTVAAVAVGLLVAWFCFYLLGRTLTLIPVGADPVAVETGG